MSVNTCADDVITPSKDTVHATYDKHCALGSGWHCEANQMMVFRVGKKDYSGSTALEIVQALESDTEEYPYRGQPVRRFLKWSLKTLSKQIPPRDMHLSKRMKVEDLALNYLCLRDEYGAGQLLIDRGDDA